MPHDFLNTIIEDMHVEMIFESLANLLSIRETNMQYNLESVGCILSQDPSKFSKYTAVIFFAYDKTTHSDNFKDHTDVVIVNESTEDWDYIYHVASGKVLSLKEAVEIIGNRCDFVYGPNAHKGFAYTYEQAVQEFNKHNTTSCDAQAQRVRGMLKQPHRSTSFFPFNTKLK